MRSRNRGSTIIEFVLTTSLIYVPLLLGTMVIGLNIIRAIQVNQLNRDAGHMFARGVDFTAPSNRAMLLHLATGLNITDHGGDGVIILSTILHVGQDECPDGCANLGYDVITRRITIGNTSIRESRYGTPANIDANGNVINYLNDLSARANGFSSVMTLQGGDVAYVAESFFSSPDYDIPGFMEDTGVAAQAIF